jgi:hypothetical protein
MKSAVYLVLIVLVITGQSCYFEFAESINGNGNVRSEERSIDDFDGLKVSSGIDVFIKQGSEVSLMLEADENLHDAIETEVINNTLKIYTSKRIRKARAMKVYLVYVELNSIRVSSAGDVKGENTLETRRLEIDLSSAGDLDIDLVAEEVSCDISSSGDARLSGTADFLNADLSSAGDLYAFDLVTQKCKVSCSSAGDARVYATEELNLRSSSAGNIYYKGEGQVTAKASSAGSVIKR